MKSQKILIVLGLCAAMMISNVYATGFTDVKEKDWFAVPINELVKKGSIKGYEDGSFKPMATISKAEFVTLIVRAMGYEPDVINATHWSAGAFIKARKEGLLKIGELNQNTDASINRYDMALLVSRGLELRKDTIPNDYRDYKGKVIDYGSIPEIYKDAVLISVASGILGGYPDKSFHGERSLTRAEAAVVIDRLLNPKTRIVLEKPSEKGKIKIGETKSLEDFFEVDAIKILKQQGAGYEFTSVTLLKENNTKIEIAPKEMFNSDESYILLKNMKPISLGFVQNNKIIWSASGETLAGKEMQYLKIEEDTLKKTEYIIFIECATKELKMIENPFKK